MNPQDKNIHFAKKLIFIIVLINIVVTYYFYLLASPSAGGFGRFFLLLGSSIICPIIGYSSFIVILKLFKKLDKTTLKYAYINLVLLANIFVVGTFSFFITIVSESMFKIFGTPTITVKELVVNSDSSCSYKFVINSKSPFPIINARIWEGSLLFIEFTNDKSFPVTECSLAGEKFINIYPGNNVITGVTNNFGTPELSSSTLDGLDIISLYDGYNISSYVGIGMYEWDHQLRFKYSKEKQNELLEMLYLLR